MSLCYCTRSAARSADTKESSLPSGFMLGIAIAALIWAALGVGTTISVSSTVLSEAPGLTLTR